MCVCVCIYIYISLDIVTEYIQCIYIYIYIHTFIYAYAKGCSSLRFLKEVCRDLYVPDEDTEQGKFLSVHTSQCITGAKMVRRSKIENGHRVLNSRVEELLT